MKAKQKLFVVAEIQTSTDIDIQFVFTPYKFLIYCTDRETAETFLQNVQEPYYYLTILEIYQ